MFVATMADRRVFVEVYPGTTEVPTSSFQVPCPDITCMAVSMCGTNLAIGGGSDTRNSIASISLYRFKDGNFCFSQRIPLIFAPFVNTPSWAIQHGLLHLMAGVYDEGSVRLWTLSENTQEPTLLWTETTPCHNGNDDCVCTVRRDDQSCARNPACPVHCHSESISGSPPSPAAAPAPQSRTTERSASGR